MPTHNASWIQTIVCDLGGAARHWRLKKCVRLDSNDNKTSMRSLWGMKVADWRTDFAEELLTVLSKAADESDFDSEIRDIKDGKLTMSDNCANLA